MSNQPETRDGDGKVFIVVSANFGGAARQVKYSDSAIADRPEALGGFIRDPTGAGRLDAYPVVAGIQEVSRTESSGVDHDVMKELIGSAYENAQLFYVPTVSTAWYPLKAKWQARWKEQVCCAEQGMAVCGIRGVTLIDPEQNSPSACTEQMPFKGMVLNLPVVKFRDRAKADSNTNQRDQGSSEGWINHTAAFGDAEPFTVQFRHTRYLGNRDTEPRIATAHRIRLDGKEAHESPVEFVFINVHLTTLREEDRSGVAQNSEKPDEFLARTRRMPTQEAEFLRHLQLSEICDFIWYVYRELQLPVVVAGDFNSTLDRPDLKAFMAAACIRPVFKNDRCWACDGAPLSQSKRLYSGEKRKAILTEDRQSFERITGEIATPILATEYCSSCNSPLFTHKRNFKFIDNILYTDGIPPNTPLKSTIELSAPLGSAGIGTDTYFSDHFPIWAMFRVI